MSPHVKACIDVVKKLGGEFVVACANGDNSQTAVRRFYRNMKELGEYAVENGITICLATHQIIIPNGKEAAKAVRKINSKGVKINYDTGNVIFYTGDKLEEDLKYALPYLGHVHLKDKIGGKDVYNFPPVGDGSIDFLSLLKMLMEKGYSGPFSIEIEWQRETKRTVELVDQGVKKSYDYLRDLFLRLSR